MYEFKTFKFIHMLYTLVYDFLFNLAFDPNIFLHHSYDIISGYCDVKKQTINALSL